MVPHPLWCVSKDQFEMEQISDNLTLGKWFQNHELEFHERSVYLELDCDKDDSRKILDVILFDKVCIVIP